MLNDFKHWLKSFFALRKSEQRGIIILLFLLLLILAFNLFLPGIISSNENVNPANNNDVRRFIAAQHHLDDSLLFVKLQRHGNLNNSLAARFMHPVPFDPNTVSEKVMQQMGLNHKQIFTILNYRKHNGLFLKKTDLQKIYGLSSVEYHILEPYIMLHSISHTAHHQNIRKQLPTDLNSCTPDELAHREHVKPWLAERIVKYRNLLGGFYSIEQLNEVYGMKKRDINKIKASLIIDTTKIHKINLNKAKFKTILHHPYFDYKTTKKLFYLRDKLHGFNNLTQLKAQHIIPDSAFDHIRHYLYIRPLKN